MKGDSQFKGIGIIPFYSSCIEKDICWCFAVDFTKEIKICKQFANIFNNYRNLQKKTKLIKSLKSILSANL